MSDGQEVTSDLLVPFFFDQNSIIFDKMERFNGLDDVLSTAWNLLFRATVQRRDPYRTPVLSTINQENIPDARTIVLRETKVQKRQLIFYTDTRSPKVEELKANPNICLVFWNPSRNVQVRASGRMLLEQGNAFSKEYWDKIAPKNRRDYSTINAPSNRSEKSEGFLPDFWEAADLTPQNTEAAFENFTVLVAQIDKLDCLHIHREGHQRAQFTWNGKAWDKTWLVP